MEMESVRSTGLAFVRQIDPVGKPWPPVDLGRALDVAGRCIDHHVTRDAGTLHLRTVWSVIDVAEMSPERTVLHAPSHGEVCLSTRWRRVNPPTAGYEIRASRRRRRRSGRTADISMSRGDHDICDSVHYDVERIHGDVTGRAFLLVDDHTAAAVRQRDRLVRRTADDDRL